jgi:hypothetical protein
MHARLTRTAAIAAVVVLAVACTKSLDTSSLESTLQSQAAETLGVSDLTVSCPDNVKVQAGGTFTCTATGSGAAFTLTVTQSDDQGTVTWKVAGASSDPSATPSPA